MLESDVSMQLIVEYLKKLSDEGLIAAYAFVIMPNHIDLILQQNKLNGKETPMERFLCHEPSMAQERDASVVIDISERLPSLYYKNQAKQRLTKIIELPISFLGLLFYKVPV